MAFKKLQRRGGEEILKLIKIHGDLGKDSNIFTMELKVVEMFFWHNRKCH